MKKHFVLEKIAFWGGILIIIIYGILFEIILLELKNSIYRVLICFVFMLFLGILYGFYFRCLKKMGFEKATIEPYMYQINLDHGDILCAFNHFFSHVYRLNDESAYILEKKYGLKLRINILKFENFSKEILKQRKKSINRIINKRHKVKPYTNLANSCNKVRINFIIVKSFDEYCKELMHCNATILFSRIECVLNVILSENDGRLFVPAHFGLSKTSEYYKTVKILKKALEI